LCALAWAPLWAEANGLPELHSDIAAQFPAVGRLGAEGFEKQGCSATLIAPHLVVTAAHCLSKSTPKGQVFAADWADGTYRALARVKHHMRHPEYAANDTHSPHNDVGLVVLESPLTEVPPLPLGQRETGALDGAEPALVGFNIAHPTRLSGQLDCPAINLAVGQLYLGCPVIHGNSGSPVLVQDDTGAWQVEAIISSRIGPGAIAVYLPDWLRQKVAAHTPP